MSEIYIIDDLHPEDNAMLQALYSRSPRGVMEHVGKVRSADSGTFMEKFYVGYGHLSIADCGSTTIFVEHVSMFVAKAIQDWALYSGQEASTRYLDYSAMPILNPAGTEEGRQIQDKWIEFYNYAREILTPFLKVKYPIKEDENEKVYDKAIAARGFDILRGFLPAGSTTFLSWHTNLRQAHEKIALLEHHPLQEVRDLAVQIRAELQKKYKNSFSHRKFPLQEKFYEYANQNYNFNNPDEHPDYEFSHSLNLQELAEYNDLLEKRPEKTNLPHFLSQFGQCTFKFKLDFGSFRDIQRHRNGVCRMPQLTTKFGFYPWYLEQLPDELRASAEALIIEQEKAIKALPCDDLVRQYYIPMGYSIATEVTYALPASIYVAELRSNKTVHPTLRKRAHQMAKSLQEALPQMKMHVDLNLDDWDIRRGNQDITIKDNEKVFDNSVYRPEERHRSGGVNPVGSAGRQEVLSQDNKHN